MSQDPAACLVGEGVFLKFASGDAGNSVMSREPVVEKCIIRRPQIERVVVLMDLAFEEQPRFGSERRPQVFVCAMRLIEQIPQNPSFEEARHHVICFGILQHSPNLAVRVRRAFADRLSLRRPEERSREFRSR